MHHWLDMVLAQKIVERKDIKEETLKRFLLYKHFGWAYFDTFSSYTSNVTHFFVIIPRGNRQLITSICDSRLCSNLTYPFMFSAYEGCKKCCFIIDKVIDILYNDFKYLKRTRVKNHYVYSIRNREFKCTG